MAPSSTLDLDLDRSSTTTTSSKPTVYVLDTFPPAAIKHARTLFNVILSTDEAFQGWEQKATALLIRGSYFQAEDVARCPNLLAIGKHGVGIDKIDQKACQARGIKILNTPGANARAVAELVLALTMAVARQIRSVTVRQCREPVPKETCSGLTLYGKKIGILGMGHIGKTVAQIFRGGFDAEIIAYDPYMPADAWADIPHQRASTVQEVIEASDVLTIHVPLTETTRDLISYKQLRSMKPTAILINAARGGIVNEDDLGRALSEGLIWGAGLDCHEQEPPTAEKYGNLWENLNLVSTPHIGAATADTQLRCAMMAVDNLHKYITSL